MKKKIIMLLCATLMLTGCAGASKANEDETSVAKARVVDKTSGASNKSAKEEKERREKLVQEAVAEAKENESNKKASGTIVIDPGHSAVVAEGSEPLGPGSSEYKAADASGTSGVSTGVKEYELTLDISEQLKEELEARGYTVIMTRESNDVPISCIQRADVANNAGADAYVRVHANGSGDSSVTGAMTICTTPDSPYVPELYTASRQLSDCIIQKYCEATGCRSEGVWETDTMSGNNWSQVPVTIIEMGYMTNPEEDQLMETIDYQQKMVQGIANGIDQYLGNDL